MPTVTDTTPAAAAAWASLSSALDALLAALRRVWSDPTFRADPSAGRDPTRITVRTIQTVDGVEVDSAGRADAPMTEWLVRGSPGIETRVSGEDRFRTRPITVSALVTQALLRQRSSGFGDEPPMDAWTAMRDATQSIVAAIREVPVLGRRLYDARGYRVYEPEELETRLRDDSPSDAMFGVIIALDDIVTTAFAECSLDPHEPAAFDGWNAVRTAIWEQLRAIARIEHHRYRATAFLNGPLMRTETGIVIADLEDIEAGALRGPIILARATNDDLAAVAREYPYTSLPPGVDAANTRLTFDFVVEADGPTEEYRTLYPSAAAVVGWVTDVLRLVLGTDIGASYVDLKPASAVAPYVPKNYAWEYQPEHSIHIPRRMTYRPPDGAVLTDEQVAAVSRLLRARMLLPDVVGLPVALRRFRDSYERYIANDPERLLDLVIALEAVVMNDQQKDQVAHRLRVRVARLLGSTRDERRAIYRSDRDAVRSPLPCGAWRIPAGARLEGRPSARVGSGGRPGTRPSAAYPHARRGRPFRPHD